MQLSLRLVMLLLASVPAGIAVAQSVEYIHTDALGSIVAVTDESGLVVKRSSYEPYGGNISSQRADGPGYTGHVEDAATSLTYMQQRYYDPDIGRFLSSDPVRVSSRDGNFNRYAYVANNPYSAIDPDGRYLCKGSAELCGGMKKALNSIRSSAKAQTGTRITNSRSAQVSRFYGKEGVDNGVEINETSINAYGKAETSGNTTTISFNPSAMQKMSSPDTTAQSIFNATALHEGSHGVDQRDRLGRGLAPMTSSRASLHQGELRAYRAEAAYHESLGVRSPWGLWEVKTGRDEGLIREEAQNSVNTACGLGRCTP